MVCQCSITTAKGGTTTPQEVPSFERSHQDSEVSRGGTRGEERGAVDMLENWNLESTSVVSPVGTSLPSTSAELPARGSAAKRRLSSPGNYLLLFL